MSLIVIGILRAEMSRSCSRTGPSQSSSFFDEGIESGVGFSSTPSTTSTLRTFSPCTSHSKSNRSGYEIPIEAKILITSRKNIVCQENPTTTYVNTACLTRHEPCTPLTPPPTYSQLFSCPSVEENQEKSCSSTSSKNEEKNALQVTEGGCL